MKHFDKLHSYTEPDKFLSWISKNRLFLIQIEIGGGYGLIPNTNDASNPLLLKYHELLECERRETTLRTCYESYLKIINEL